MYGRIPYLNNDWSSWAIHRFFLRHLPYYTAVWLGASPSVPLTNTLLDLWHALYNSYNLAEDRPINTCFLNEVPQENIINWPTFSKQEFRDAIAKCSLSSSSGPNHISWGHLKHIVSNDTCLKKLLNIADACFNLGYWPSHFKTANSIIIPKPNKDSYSTSKSFHPIVLLNTTDKLIEKAISNQLQFHMVANRFLDSNQLRGIRQWSTTDAGIYLTYFIQAGWLRQYHTSVIAFDIVQFFLSLNHHFLSICLKKAGLNTNVRNFFRSDNSGHSTSYLWNSFISSVTNFIQPYLYQFFDNSHGLNSTQKPLKRPFDQY